MLHEIDFANFADDTTPYVEGASANEVIKKLEQISSDLFKWFELNQMKANPDKCNFIINTDNLTKLSIGESEIISSKSVKLLGVHIDNRLKFDQDINLICKKANQKLHALARVSSYMDISKKKVLFNAFFFSQFSYCPLTWMCHSREQNAKINRLHEKCLRLIYHDKKFSFQEMLDRDKSVNIHHKNLQQLSIEMFKVVKGLSPEIFSNLFSEKESSGYNLRSNDGL